MRYLTSWVFGARSLHSVSVLGIACVQPLSVWTAKFKGSMVPRGYGCRTGQCRNRGWHRCILPTNSDSSVLQRHFPSPPKRGEPWGSSSISVSEGRALHREHPVCSLVQGDCTPQGSRDPGGRPKMELHGDESHKGWGGPPPGCACCGPVGRSPDLVMARSLFPTPGQCPWSRGTEAKVLEIGKVTGRAGGWAVWQ